MRCEYEDSENCNENQADENKLKWPLVARVRATGLSRCVRQTAWRRAVYRRWLLGIALATGSATFQNPLTLCCGSANALRSLQPDLRYAEQAWRRLTARSSYYENPIRGHSTPTTSSLARRLWTLALSHYVLREHVEGDFVEAGVYRGATSVAMMFALDEWNSSHALHWACDSFEGLPAVSKSDVAATRECWRLLTLEWAAGDTPRRGCDVGKRGLFRATRAALEAGVQAYGVSRDRLRIVQGWFADVLPAVGMGRISFLRVDGDLHNSTRDALVQLYPRLSPGGVVYIDDVGSFAGCWQAVHDFRQSRGIRSPLQRIYEMRTNFRSFEAAFWMKPP